MHNSLYIVLTHENFGRLMSEKALFKCHIDIIGEAISLSTTTSAASSIQIVYLRCIRYISIYNPFHIVQKPLYPDNEIRR